MAQREHYVFGLFVSKRVKYFVLFDVNFGWNRVGQGWIYVAQREHYGLKL